jgi:PAS domain S-box-containing protein
MPLSAFDVDGLFDLTPCGLVVCDDGGVVLRGNALFAQLTGRQGAGELFADMLTRPARFIFAARVMPQLRLAGEMREVALDLVGPDGAPVPVLVNATRGEMPDGRTVHYFAVFPARGRRELEQEFLEAKRELTQSRDYLQLAEKLAHVGHWRTDLKTGACYWSPEIYKIYNIDPSTFEPVLQGSEDFYHPDDRDEVRALVADAIARKGDFTFRKRLIQARTGEIRWVHSHGICECDPTGEVVGLFGVFRDITESVHARQEIERSEVRYRLLADHANDIITIFDLDGYFDYLSPAVTKMLGYKPEELVGRTVGDIIHPDDYAATQAAYRDFVRSKDWENGPRVQYRARHKDGHYIWAEANPTVILSENGLVAAFQDTVRDISQQKATEAALEKARLEADAAAEAKAHFLATMSHELRTPLTSIIGFSALLCDLLEGDEALVRHSQRIHLAGQGLLGLINDILDHSKLEAGQLELDLAPCDVAEVAHEVVELLGVQAGAKGLELAMTGVEHLPPALLLDEGRIRQILFNLISNAIKFTQKGTVTLAMRMHPSGEDEGLCISVRDTGVGISPEGQARLFQRFSQVDHNRDGTGLGLMICKQLVELMGGEIGVVSREGEGSEFWFDIPVMHSAPPAEVYEVAVSPARLLVVDDQEAVRDLLTGLLTPQGHEVILAADGAEALTLCEKAAFDLIFMDINMPVMNGIAAARALRDGDGPNCGTPIIAMTAADSADRHRACMTNGMNDILGKPLDRGALNRMLGDWLAPPDIFYGPDLPEESVA